MKLDAAEFHQLVQPSDVEQAFLVKTLGSAEIKLQFTTAISKPTIILLAELERRWDVECSASNFQSQEPFDGPWGCGIAKGDYVSVADPKLLQMSRTCISLLRSWQRYTAESHRPQHNCGKEPAFGPEV